MKIELEVPEYSPQTGMKFLWEDGFRIAVRIDPGNQVVLSANKEGCISLARHLLELAQIPASQGAHFHLDQYNALEDDSCEIVIERTF